MRIEAEGRLVDLRLTSCLTVSNDVRTLGKIRLVRLLRGFGLRRHLDEQVTLGEHGERPLRRALKDLSAHSPIVRFEYEGPPRQIELEAQTTTRAALCDRVVKQVRNVYGISLHWGARWNNEGDEVVISFR